MAGMKTKEKLKLDFRNKLLKYVDMFNSAVSTENGDCIV
jgi:hypothetical protein